MNRRLLHLSVLCLVWSLTGCQWDDRGSSGSSSEPLLGRFENISTEVDFVGDKTCASCHEEIYHGYQDHGMANSVYALSDSTAAAAYPSPVLYDTTRNFYYRAYQDDGRFYQEEFRLNDAGEKTHRLIREMKFVVGSGSAAHTYLTENGQRYYELPLTFYTQEGRWDFSPGYREGNQRFDREIPDRCMACHNSYPESVAFVNGKYRSMPEGIGCERCHGPGERHADERLVSMEPPDSIDFTIVNPAHLSMDRRMDVCQQCHLHGTVSLLREGRGPFDFRPGEPLAAHLALFSTRQEQNPADDEIAVISHADRLKNSACFAASRETRRPMDCVTCHDPHEGFRSAGPEYFNSTCRGCHSTDALQERLTRGRAQKQHVPTANCISCHMPKVPAEDAPHASFTDHWIRVVGDTSSAVEPDAAAPASAHDPVELAAYFPDDTTGPGEEIYRGMAYVVYGTQKENELSLRRGIQMLDAALETGDDDGEPFFQLGLAHQQLGHAEEAVPALEQAVRIDPDIPERLNALAQAYETAGRDTADIGPLYRRALAVQPAAARIRVNYGRFLESHGRLQAARVQYEKVVEEDSWFAIGHYNLGTAYLREGRMEEGEQALQRAIELRPDYPEALTNLGAYYANQDRQAQARQYMERAVDVAPDHPEALTNLGLFYVLNGRARAAIPVLERAVAVDSLNTDAVANLGLANFRLERYEAARRLAERALRIDSTHPLARQIVEATAP